MSKYIYKKPRWTKEEDEMLVRYYTVERFSLDRSARKLNRSISAVKNRLYILGFERATNFYKPSLKVEKPKPSSVSNVKKVVKKKPKFVKKEITILWGLFNIKSYK